MDLDLTTVLVCCALGTLVSAAVFATTVAFRHNDEANRAWVAGLAAAVCVTGLMTIYDLDSHTPPVVIAMIDASSVFSLGALWSGFRASEGRHGRIWVPLGAALIAAAPGLFQSTPINLDGSAAVRLGLTGLAAWMCSLELMRGSMSRNLNSRILQVTMFIFGGWYVAAAALFAAADGPLSTRPPTTSLCIPFAAVFIVVPICLSALRVERSGNWWSMSSEITRRSNLDVLAPEAFREDARDRLERAGLTGHSLTLVLAEIAALDELNSAFGREAGDTAMMHFTHLLRSHLPASALIGHLGAGRFAILTDMTSRETPAAIIDAVRTGLLDAALNEDMPIRIDALFGTSHTSDKPTTFEGLLTLASSELDVSRV